MALEEISHQVLEVFDELDRDELDLHALIEFAAGNDPERRDNVVEAVETLTRDGYLEPAGGGDFYRRTEEGRLAVAGPHDATLDSRPRCRLCDEARATIEPILRKYGAKLREVNIDEDAELPNFTQTTCPSCFLARGKWRGTT